MDLLQTVRKEGSRGGRAEFKWEDVKADSQRENYLGHSVMAPVGRWQKGKDLNWYARGDNDDDQTAAEKLAEEKRRIKEAEEDAMLAAMGLPVPDRASTNANLTPLGQKAHEANVQKAITKAADEDEVDVTPKGARDKDTKERRRKERTGRDHDDRRRRHHSRSRSRERHRRRRSRSRSQDRRAPDFERRRHRSRSYDGRHDDRYYRRRRYSDEGRRRPRSRSRERARRRSRSPLEKSDRYRR